MSISIVPVAGRPAAGAGVGATTSTSCDASIDTGSSTGYAVVPAITGSSIKAVRLSEALFGRGISVQPILYPAVQERAARLRFFMNYQHTDADIDNAVSALAEEMERL